RTTVDLPAHQDTKVEVPFYYKWSNLKKGQYLYQIDGNNFYFTVVDTKTIPYTLTSAGYGTICLPFEAEVPSGMTAYSCASLNDKELVLTPITGKMQPHTPYVLSGSEQTVTFAGPDIPNLKSTYTDGLLKGVIGTDYLLQADDYIMQNHSGNVAFYRVGSGSRFGQPATQYRSLLTSSSAVATVMFPDNEATAVETIAETPAFEPEAIYSLDGKRRASLQKGINILRTADGRTMKVLVK
ncbi:MAG: hypothetical protein HUK02_02880, partial [Bacteroidaceae bacterium]|nr:hypothetical protein [Bacteroidaceae bacterium]